MTTTLTVLEDRVLILEDTPQQISEGGIILPESAQTKETIGTVKAIGPGLFYDLYDFGGLSQDAVVRRRPMSVKVNDRVIYPKYAGTNVKIGKVEYKVVTDAQIISIIESDESEMTEEVKELVQA